MAKTSIEWADWSVNPIRTADGGYHCTKVSEGCEHCWAEVFNRRFGNGKPFDAAPTEFVLDEKPFEKLARARKPRRVFLQSMGDICHPDVSDDAIYTVFAWIAHLSRHTFMLLTKRPERLLNRFGEIRSHCGFVVPQSYPVVHRVYEWPLPNLWLGVTAENQQRADERIPILLQIPAAKRFVSIEPMLGPVDLTNLDGGVIAAEYRGITLDALIGGRKSETPWHLNWVIAGGETGPGARPAHPDWFRKVRDECKEAGVAFFLKAWGDWAPFEVASDPLSRKVLVSWQGEIRNEFCGFGRDMPEKGWHEMVRVGKKRAGRLLDGREHNELPGVLSRA